MVAVARQSRCVSDADPRAFPVEHTQSAAVFDLVDRVHYGAYLVSLTLRRKVPQHILARVIVPFGDGVAVTVAVRQCVGV